MDPPSILSLTHPPVVSINIQIFIIIINPYHTIKNHFNSFSYNKFSYFIFSIGDETDNNLALTKGPSLKDVWETMFDSNHFDITVKINILFIYAHFHVLLTQFHLLGQHDRYSFFKPCIVVYLFG